MTAWEQFKVSVVGHPLKLTQRDYDWVFQFSAGLNINVEADWRIRNSSRILLTNGDDQQQSGLQLRVRPANRDRDARPDRRGGLVVRHHRDRHVRRVRSIAVGTDELESRFVWHVEVDEDRIRWQLAQPLQGFGGGRSGVHLTPH